MKPIEIRAEAELDIIEAALWYENEREGFGAEFSLEVERAVARIAENPLMFQEREWGCAWQRSVASPTVCTSSTSSTRSYYLASSIFIAIPRFGSIRR
jgi:plasmid stabilization system protein ParE